MLDFNWSQTTWAKITQNIIIEIITEWPIQFSTFLSQLTFEKYV